MTPEQRAEIVRLYSEERWSLERIRQALACARDVVTRVLDEEGVPRRPPITPGSNRKNGAISLLPRGKIPPDHPLASIDAVIMRDRAALKAIDARRRAMRQELGGSP